MSCFLFVLIVKTIDIIIKTLDNVVIQNPRSISSDVIKFPIIIIALAIITIKGKFFFINLVLSEFGQRFIPQTFSIPIE